MTTRTNPVNHAHYRRLVHAYPAGRRREELLDTMIMAAQDSARRRPSGREVVDVLRHAPRAWLGRPASRSVVAYATMVAVMTALLTGCLAARATATAQYRALPNAAALTDLGALVAPGVALRTEQRHDRPGAVVDGEPRYGFAHLRAQHDAGTRDTRSFTQGVVTRLRQAGWHTRWLTETPRHSSDDLLIATRDGLVITVETIHWGDAASDGSIGVTVHRAEPDAVFAVGAIGAALGLLLGWLLTGWASRRTEHHRWAGDALAALTVLAMVTMAPWALYTITQFADGLSYDLEYLQSPFWGWTMFGSEATVLTTPAVLATVAATAVLAFTRPNRSGTSGPAPTSGRPAIMTPRPPTITGGATLTTTAALVVVYLIEFSLPVMGDTVTILTAGIAAVTLHRVAVALFRPPTATETPPDFRG